MDHQSNQTNFVWCHTHEEPFSRIPVLPLRYGSSLAQTYYATEYFDEKMYACIDNLNIAYVAFTRAEEELHIFAPAVKNKSDKGRFGSISAMLGEVLRSRRGTMAATFIMRLESIGEPRKKEKRFCRTVFSCRYISLYRTGKSVALAIAREGRFR